MRSYTAGLSVLWFAMLAAGCTPEPGDVEAAGTTLGAPQDRYARVNGVTLHYLDWGGSGDLLLLLHGLGHSAHSWDGIAPAFTDRYRVMALTRRGHGASEKTGSGFGIDTLAADVSAFLDAVGAKRAIVAGHSFAGREMPILAARERTRIAAVIFLDAVYDWAFLRDSTAGSAGAQRFYSPPDSVMESMSALEDWQRRRFPSDWGPAALATLRSQVYLRQDGHLAWQLPPERQVLFVRGSSGVDYSAIRVPVLAVWANQTEAAARNMEAFGYSTAAIDTLRAWLAAVDVRSKQRGTAALRRAVPDARIIELDAPHTLFWAKPAEVTRLMNEFLGTLPPGS